MVYVTPRKQRFMDQIFRVPDLVFCYIDDIVIMSNTIEEHKKIVLQRLQDNRFDLWSIGGQLWYLGYTVNKNGCKPPHERVAAIVAHPSILPSMHPKCDPSVIIERTNFFVIRRRMIKGKCKDSGKRNSFRGLQDQSYVSGPARSSRPDCSFSFRQGCFGYGYRCFVGKKNWQPVATWFFFPEN